MSTATHPEAPPARLTWSTYKRGWICQASVFAFFLYRSRLNGGTPELLVMIPKDPNNPEGVGQYCTCWGAPFPYKTEKRDARNWSDTTLKRWAAKRIREEWSELSAHLKN